MCRLKGKQLIRLGSRYVQFLTPYGDRADPEERTRTLYGDIKGRTEKTLSELPNQSPEMAPLRVFKVRPGLVDPPEPHKPELLIKRLISPLFRFCIPSYTSPTPELARVLVDLAMGDGEPLREAPGIEAGGTVVRSKAIRTAQWESVIDSRQSQHTDL